jgi:hypothetical protein
MIRTGLTCLKFIVPTATCGRLANNPQTNRRFPDIGCAEGVSVHLRPIERRKVRIRDYVLSEYASERTTYRERVLKVTE